MLENSLKSLWQSVGDDLKLDVEKISKSYSLEKEIKKFDSILFWRNIRESIASVIVIIVFSKYFFDNNLPFISKIGCVLIVLAGFWAIYTLWSIRKKSKIDFSNDVLSFLNSAKSYLKEEQLNNKNILFNNLLPFLPGFICFNVGLIPQSTLVFNLTNFIFGIIVYASIWWINQKAAKKYNPILAKIEEQINEWKS